MSTSQSVFSWPVRVYYEDTDVSGVVYHANYLKFFERARTEWLRSLGCSQQALREETGVMFVVTDTAVRYLQPARLDDELRMVGHYLALIGLRLGDRVCALVAGGVAFGRPYQSPFAPR